MRSEEDLFFIVPIRMSRFPLFDADRITWGPGSGAHDHEGLVANQLALPYSSLDGQKE